MKYVDGFLLIAPTKKLAAYKKLARKAGKIWMEFGALAYVECVGDDLDSKMGIPFGKLVKPKKNETIIFSYILYKSKADRNRVNKKVMADPRMASLCDPKDMPFDCNRMSYGGFKVLVDY